MRKQIRVVRRTSPRVPIAEVYGVPEAERFLNVALVHATPDIDVPAMQEGAYQRFVERERKRRRS